LDENYLIRGSWITGAFSQASTKVGTMRVKCAEAEWVSNTAWFCHSSMKLTWLGCWVFWYRWLTQAAVFLAGFGNQFVAVLQEFIQFGGFGFD